MVNDWKHLLEDDPENEDRDGIYLCDVWNLASLHSTDPSTQVGSALVSWSGGIIMGGWNEVPPPIASAGHPKTPSAKNYCTEHAERRVLFKAIRNGLRCDCLQLYSTWASCAECSRSIVQLGIRRVVTFRGLVYRTPERWRESVQEGLGMMRDAGVEIIGWNGVIHTENKIRFNGELLDATAVL